MAGNLRNVRVDDETWARAKAYAATRDTTVSALINTFLESLVGRAATPAEIALGVAPPSIQAPAPRPAIRRSTRIMPAPTGRAPKHPENAPRHPYWDSAKCIHEPLRRRHLAIGEFCADCGAEMNDEQRKRSENARLHAEVQA